MKLQEQPLHVHVALLTLADTSTTDRCVDLARTMAGRIPGLVHLDVRRNERPGPHACDLAVTTTWTDVATYEAYETDPVHLEVAAVLRSLMSSATTFDHTVDGTAVGPAGTGAA